MAPYTIVRERFPGEYYYRVPNLDASGLARISIRGPPRQGLHATLSRSDIGFTAQVIVEQTAQEHVEDYVPIVVHEFAQSLWAFGSCRHIIDPVRSNKAKLDPPAAYTPLPNGAGMDVHLPEEWREDIERITRWLRLLPPLFGPSLEARLSYGDDTAHAQVISLLRSTRDTAYAGLTPEEQYIVSRRCGWGDGTEHTLSSIGKDMERLGFRTHPLTTERIRQLEWRACGKLGSRHRKIIAINQDILE